MKLPHNVAATLFAACLLAPAPARAGDGHDHGNAPSAAAAAAQPRFAAVSDQFELVGVLNGKQITLYLDRAADNSPVKGAQIELEIGGQKFKALPRQGQHGTDEYEVVLPEAPKPGVLPITAMVSAGTETDLLAGELDIHEATHTDEPAHQHSWKESAGWAAGGIAVLAALLFAGRRVLSSRQLRVGGAS